MGGKDMYQNDSGATRDPSTREDIYEAVEDEHVTGTQPIGVQNNAYQSTYLQPISGNIPVPEDRDRNDSFQTDFSGGVYNDVETAESIKDRKSDSRYDIRWVILILLVAVNFAAVLAIGGVTVYEMLFSKTESQGQKEASSENFQALKQQITDEDQSALQRLEWISRNLSTQNYFLEQNIEQLQSKLNTVILNQRPTTCSHVHESQVKILNSTGGVYNIYPVTLVTGIEVYCDTTTDGGGWIVIQRRFDGSEDFGKVYSAYKTGFGQVQGEFWLGNEYLYKLTLPPAKFELRIDMEDWQGNKSYAVYSEFRVGSSGQNYRLSIDEYSGTAGNSLSSNDPIEFSAKDVDNDEDGKENCADRHMGGWWYRSCGNSRLNGQYFHNGIGSNTVTKGIVWRGWQDVSLKFTEMKIRDKIYRP